MEMKDLWKFILALLGFGGMTYVAMGAWAVPQTSLYAQLMPADQWLYAGDTASCIWEIHPNTTKTINGVSYGAPGSWTDCAQNSTDKLLWTCSSVTVAEGNVTCPMLRVVQNEFPGTSETTFSQNLTFKTASVKGSRFPGCTSADCTISSGASIPSGTYFMRNLIIDAAITLQGNTNLTVMENFTVGTTGSISITSSYTPYTFNISAYSFLNKGAISGAGATGATGGAGYAASYPYDCYAWCSNAGAGYPGATIIFNGYVLNNTGTINLNGGAGGYQPAACGGYACYGGGSHFCQAGTGGKGGALITSPTKPRFYSSGSISSNGGAGGDGASCCSNNAVGSDAGPGGNGGSVNVTTLNATNSGTVTTSAGNGGSSSCSCWQCGNGGSGGNGGASNISVSRNISVTNTLISSAGTGGSSGGGCSCSGGSSGSAGSWTVPYCANGTGNDWSKFTPTATTSALTCATLPSAVFVTPNATSNYTAYKQNVSVSISYMIDSLLISYSKDNGSTWEQLSPDYYSFPYNSSNPGVFTMDSYRRGSDFANYSRMKMIPYTASTGIFGDAQIVAFNVTDMATTLTGSAAPNGSVSTNTIRFTCNYTNTTASIEAATPYINLDGTFYAMSFNETAKTYYWDNTQTLLAGAHWWQCFVDKANYKSALSTNTTFNITGFGIFLPTGQTTVKMACPFPTIAGMTPSGQKAGIGIFRIQNYNSTALHNYTLFLNNTLPSGITVYGRCDRFSPNLANWTALSQSTGFKGLLNINSTNSSAYCWLRMDCASATPGTYTPFDYIFTEE
jgi:hypothetical protein